MSNMDKVGEMAGHRTGLQTRACAIEMHTTCNGTATRDDDSEVACSCSCHAVAPWDLLGDLFGNSFKGGL